MWKCKNCLEEIEDQFDICWKCGRDRNGAIPTIKEEQLSEVVIKHVEKEKEITEVVLENSKSKYPALRIIATLFKIFAWTVGIATFIVTAFYMSKEGSIAISIIAFVSGVLFVLVLLAASELIKVFIDIEYNTRRTTKRN